MDNPEMDVPEVHRSHTQSIPPLAHLHNELLPSNDLSQFNDTCRSPSNDSTETATTVRYLGPPCPNSTDGNLNRRTDDDRLLDFDDTNSESSDVDIVTNSPTSAGAVPPVSVYVMPVHDIHDDDHEDGQIDTESDSELLVIDETDQSHGEQTHTFDGAENRGQFFQQTGEQINEGVGADNNKTYGSNHMSHYELDMRHWINEKRRKRMMLDVFVPPKKSKISLTPELDAVAPAITEYVDEKEGGMLYIRRILTPEPSRDSPKCKPDEPSVAFVDVGRDETVGRFVSDHWPKLKPKTELCKFFVLGNCTKNEKCLFLHSEFPCKFYYLGIEHNGKDCNLAHGPPLSKAMGRVLLNHLAKGPAEILGDFEQFGPGVAARLFEDRQRELRVEYGLLDEDEGDETDLHTVEDVQIDGKPTFIDETDCTIRMNPFKPGLKISCISVSADLENKLKRIGVGTLGQIKQITVAQLYAHNIRVEEVYEILDTIYKSNRNVWSNRRTPPLVSTPTMEFRTPIDYGDITGNGQQHAYQSQVVEFGDRSPRYFPNYESDAGQINPNIYTQDRYNPQSPLPQSSPSHESKTPPSYGNFDVHEDYHSPEIDSHHRTPLQMSITPSIGKRTSITETCDYGRQNANSSDQSLQMDATPPHEDRLAINFNDDATEDTTPADFPAIDDVDNYKLDSRLLIPINVEGTERVDQSADAGRPDPRHNPFTYYDSPLQTTAMGSLDATEGHSKYVDPIRCAKSRDLFSSPIRVNNVDDDSPGIEDDTPPKPIELDSKVAPIIPAAVKFEIPFEPIMTNYVAATEINAACGSHRKIIYQLIAIFVPERDTDRIIQNVTARNVDVMADPRLRRLLGKNTPPRVPSECSPKMFRINSTTIPMNVKPTLSPFVPPIVSSDPRRRPFDCRKLQPTRQIVPATPPIKQYGQETLDRAAVHASTWYQELSSNHKIMVNQQMAIVSTQLQAFHSKRMPGDLFDFTFVQENPLLQQTFVNLCIFIDENGHCQKIEQPPVGRGFADCNSAPMDNRGFPANHSQPPRDSYSNSRGFHSQSNSQCSYRGRNNGNGGGWNHRRNTDYNRNMPERRMSVKPSDDNSGWDEGSSEPYQQPTIGQGNRDNSERVFRAPPNPSEAPTATKRYSFQDKIVAQTASPAVEEECWDDD